MKESYFEAIVMIERLHRLFLEVVKVELDHLNIRDINNVQALVLYNIGQDQVTVGELTNRGYYLGSNVSYNLRKMVQNAYVLQEPSPHDRRSSHVRLSAKGVELYQKLDKVMTTHTAALERESGDKNMPRQLSNLLKKLEIFWTHLLTKI